MANKIEIIIPENTSVKDFAIAVADILIEDYGKHNYELFINTLSKEIGFDIVIQP
jgi:hypothetical protein